MPKDKKQREMDRLLAEEKAAHLMPVRKTENKNMRKRRRREARRLERQLTQSPSPKATNLKTKELDSAYRGEEHRARFREGAANDEMLERMVEEGMYNPQAGRKMDEDSDVVTRNHTHYFRGTEAEANNISVKDGKIVDAQGKRLDTAGASMAGRLAGKTLDQSFIYALDGGGQMRAIDSQPRFRAVKHGTPHWLRKADDLGAVPDRRVVPELPKPEPELKQSDSNDNEKEGASSSASSSASSTALSTSELERREGIRKKRQKMRDKDEARLAEDRQLGGKLSSLSSVDSRVSSFTDSSNGEHISARMRSENEIAALQMDKIDRVERDHWSLGWMNHSSLFAGGDVAGAGELRVEDGELLGINNMSGHYKPNEEMLWQTVNHLHQQGVPMERAQAFITDQFNRQTAATTLRMLGYNHGQGIASDIKDKNKLKDKNVNDIIKELGGDHVSGNSADSGVSNEQGLVKALSEKAMLVPSGGNLINTKSGMLRHVDPSQMNDRSTPILRGEHDDLDKPQQPKTEVETSPQQPQTTSPSVAPRGKGGSIMERIAMLTAPKPSSESGKKNDELEVGGTTVKISALKEALKKAGLNI